jgi:hypothetical protein
MSDLPLITVSILLKGDQLDPEYVSEKLRIQPNSSHRKGDKGGGIRPGTKPYIKKTGVWDLFVDNKLRRTEPVFNEVPKLVDELLQKFEGLHEPLDQMTGVTAASLDILIIGDVKEKLAKAEFFLGKERLLRICQLGLGIYITTSFSDD